VYVRLADQQASGSAGFSVSTFILSAELDKGRAYSDVLISVMEYMDTMGVCDMTTCSRILEENLIRFVDDARSRSFCESLQTQHLAAYGSLNIFCVGASYEFRLAFTIREVAGGNNLNV
jgi:hypothetical protein